MSEHEIPEDLKERHGFLKMAERENLINGYEERELGLIERIATLQAKLARLPADWWIDSSLNTWFPLTAEELERTKSDLQAAKDELHDRNEHIKYAYAALGDVNASVYLFDHIQKLKAENERLYDALKLAQPFAESELKDWGYSYGSEVENEPRRIEVQTIVETIRAAIAAHDSKHVAMEGK